MSTHTDANRATRMPRSARRAQLLAAATGAFVRYGYHAAAMDDIAERAGVSKPVLYQHFPGKMDLYLAVLDEQVAVLTGAVRQGLAATDDNQQRIRQVLSAYFDFVEGAAEGGDAGAFRLLFESDLSADPEVRARVEQSTDLTVAAVAATVRADTGLPADQAHLLGVALIGAAQVAAKWWLDTGRSIPKDEAVRLLGTLQWRGISNFPRHTG
ncbi:TetR/AcrR family transcriptional regulator [Jatrophihabitans sp. YIM 134969]